jgi:hypothetical protein
MPEEFVIAPSLHTVIVEMHRSRTNQNSSVPNFTNSDWKPLLALENALDVPSAVQYTDNFNRVGDYSIENNVPANGKTLNPRSQLISVAP